MAFSHLFKLASTDLAIDLGTANTVVYARGRGIVINEPSVVAMEMHNGVRRVRAVGADAKLMMGKTPAYLKTIRPLRNGVIADLEVAEQMIKHFIHKANGGRSRFMRGPQIVICVPSGSTQVERRAIRDAASNAGASSVSLLVEPIAAANGAGLAVITPTGSDNASAIWPWLMVISLGTPLTKSRPFKVMISPTPSSGIMAMP